MLAALTAASEKVSFTKVIEDTPGLRELDALGRRHGLTVAAEPRDRRGRRASSRVLTVALPARRLRPHGRVRLRTVGATALGDIYLAANTVPNIIFEIVAGGALASLVVPLLAGPVAAGDRRRVAAATSALLTWTLTLLIPLAVVVALAAGPIIAGLLPRPAPRRTRSTRARACCGSSRRSCRCTGSAIVLTGVLQAHRRFAWPVIAPLLSSVIVASTYVLFAVAGTARGRTSPEVSVDGELILSVGTTLGVVVLSLCLLIPLRPLRLACGRTWRLAAGDAAAAAARLALAGAVTVGSQQIAVLASCGWRSRGPERHG